MSGKQNNHGPGNNGDGSPPASDTAYRRELEQQHAELHTTREALEAARNRYMDLYDAAPVGFVTLGRHGVIREANLTAAEILGRNRQGLIDRPLAGFLAPEQSQNLFAHLRHARAERGRTTTEILLQGPGEAPLPVRLDTICSTSAEATPTYFTTLTDLSEQKRLEAENRARHREQERISRAALVGEIASTLAHDLNQPLAAITNYAAAARNDLADPSSSHERAQEILLRLMEQVDYAGDLIRSVRDMLRPNNAAQEAMDLNGVLADARKLVSKFAEEHGVGLHMELAADLPSLTGNTTQLKQVVVNLIVNAVEAYAATEVASPEVTVRSRRGENGGVLVEVIDRAGGMDEETRQSLFEPFYSTKPNGLGMGLAICHTIVESHGGSLGATANDSGGTTMYFRVPEV